MFDIIWIKFYYEVFGLTIGFWYLRRNNNTKGTILELGHYVIIDAVKMN